MLDHATDSHISANIKHSGTKKSMDVLEPWLAATIEGKLGEALRHREDSTNGHQSTEEFQALSYDDGSNLRISSGKKGSVVQITKVSKASFHYYNSLTTLV